MAKDLVHYMVKMSPLSPGDLLLLVDTVEAMTSRMSEDLRTIPTIDQRRVVVTEVVQVVKIRLFLCISQTAKANLL